MSNTYQQFEKTLVYQAAATIPQIQNDIVQIAQFDREKERKQRKWGWAIAICGIGGFACFMLGIVTETPVLILGLPLGIVGTIISAIMWKINKSANVDDNRYLLLSKLLKLLKADTAKDAQVSVRMDLRNPDHKSKFTHKGSAGPWKVKFYDDGWLQLRGKLMDGSSYQLAVAEKFQARSRWKTNARGKTKHKSKTKSATAVVLRIKPKSAKHAYLQNLANDVPSAVQLPPFVELKSVTLENGCLVLKAGTKKEWSTEPQGRGSLQVDGVQMVAMMFLSLYQVVNLSKKVSKSA